MKKIAQRTFGVIAPSFPPALLGGGPTKTLAALVSAAPHDVDLFVFTPDRDARESTSMEVSSNRWSSLGDRDVYYCSDDRAIALFAGLRAVRRRRPDVIYLNSFFNFRYSIVFMLLRMIRFWRGARFLVAPRGEFSPGALAMSRLKKRPLIGLFRWLHLFNGVTWHASTSLEADQIRAVVGSEAHVVIRENETALPLTPAPSRAGAVEGPLQAVILSRINRKKGFDIVLEALAQVSAAVKLDIYGNEEDERYAAECHEMASRLPKHILCEFHGGVAPDAVLDIFAGSDVFVFPTAGENFGHVIAESLAGSCPVIVSSETPWTDVVVDGGGIVVPSRDPREWAGAIDEFAALTATDRLERHARAGVAYARWRTEKKGPHVFDLLDAVGAPDQV